MELSREQIAAVTRSGQDACCVAGPGSGKTTVLVERFAWLVEQGYDPQKILAITFTDKAATQIKARLVKSYEKDRNRRRAVERAPVSTIHAFCLGVLRENAVAAGIDPAFVVLDEREAEAAQAAAMETVLDRLAAERQPEFAACVEAWPAGDMASALRSVYESLRMGGGAKQALSRLARFDARIDLDAAAEELREILDSSPPPKSEAQRKRIAAGREWLASRASLAPMEWLDSFSLDRRSFAEGHPIHDGLDRVKMKIAAALRAVAGEMFEAQRALLREALLDFDDEYRRRKRALAALDFDDLEEFALALLEGDSQLRRDTQERYEAILMDELQDTNPVQWKILDCVRRPGRFFAVGDINQSIYGFRHAVPEQFSAYEQAVAAAGGAVDRLERNYRSRRGILETVEAITVTQPRAGIATHRLIPGRELPAAPGPFVEVQRVEGKENGEEEMWIARWLRELHGAPVGEPPRPARFSDMAVLARSATSFDALEEALERFGIPCVVTRGRNFFEAPEALDLTNWLRVMENPKNEIALMGLLRSPFFGVPDEELMRMRMGGGLAPAEAMERIAAARRLREEIPADRILARQLDETGYLASLHPRARANVEKFLRLVRELDAAAPGDLTGHLRLIGDLRTTGKEPHAPEVEARDAVQILTIHSAKGLEFPIVALASLHRGTGGFDAPIRWSRQFGLGLRWRLADREETIADPAYEAIGSETGRREDCEEDRLLYVAMTRAEERLLLSWTNAPRARSPWPALVERGLGIKWAASPGEPFEVSGVRVTAREGAPEILERVAAEAGGDAVRIEPLAETPQASAGISVTALSTFDACPRRYFLQSVLRWPQPEATGMGGAMALGSEVHEFLGGLREEVSAEARELAGAFESSELGKRARAARRAEREMDFLVEVDGSLLRGQIDLWFEEQGKVAVVDYKTDRQLSAARLRAYSLQLRLYAIALERWTGKQAGEAWLFSLRDGVAHRVELDAEARREALRVLAAWREAETRGEFPLHETAECGRCPYVAGACPAAQPAD